ncbi:diguanylate cyclase [Gimesia aquarii]|uniref:diguanylate cyclase n=1 Tax=Gimesia aquarii TaxID=2527964 RepID=A0A517WTH9_9PLAN|nr:diguanylate cyclase [Gimesia aquarii]QDU08561.1 putative diguanylate cyclase YdaM [Gimesia aquarii]
MNSPLIANSNTVQQQNSVHGSYNMDSSQILKQLLALSEEYEEFSLEGNESDDVDQVISRKHLRKLLTALQARDAATLCHSRRVAFLAKGIATNLGWEGIHLKRLEIAALVHDIGKIGVPDHILFKPGKLTSDEIELMSHYHNIGLDVLQACRTDHEVLTILSQTRYHFSGATNGYQYIGSDVHQGARILAIADAYDSLATDQVYRSGKKHDEIMSILMESAGTQFDGNIVCALSRWEQNEKEVFHDALLEVNRLYQPKPFSEQEAQEANLISNIFSYLFQIESLYDGVYIVNSDLQFVIFSPGLEKLADILATDVLGETWTSNSLPLTNKEGTSLTTAECSMNRVIANGKPMTTEYMLERPGGRLINIEVQSVPMFNDEGHLVGVAEIYRDLSRGLKRPQEFSDLKLAASMDALTSVANRGELETQLAIMLARINKEQNSPPLSIMFIDADHFKNINDTYGHSIGDDVLIELARLFQHETYSGELVGRYGGEEFVILCPETDLEHAVKKAERLRLAISNLKIENIIKTRLSASFGVAQAESGDTVESLFRRADKALYNAKETGRNRVCSLTNHQLLTGEEPAQVTCESTSDEMLFENTFNAFISSDIVVYKLGGFVNDNDAKLTEVNTSHAILRLGQTGLLPFWGKTDDRRPVEVEVEFGNFVKKTDGNKRSSTSQVEIKVRISPLGWVKQTTQFQQRANRVFRLLKNYFAAD